MGHSNVVPIETAGYALYRLNLGSPAHPAWSADFKTEVKSCHNEKAWSFPEDRVGTGELDVTVSHCYWVTIDLVHPTERIFPVTVYRRNFWRQTEYWSDMAMAQAANGAH